MLTNMAETQQKIVHFWGCKKKRKKRQNRAMRGYQVIVFKNIVGEWIIVANLLEKCHYLTPEAMISHFISVVRELKLKRNQCNITHLG